MAKQIVALDSQRLNMIQMCAYKYDLTFNKDLVPVEREAPFERGSLMHHMVETYYSMHKYRARWPRDFDRAKMKKIILTVGDRFAAKLSLPTTELEDNFRTIKDYIDYYWDEPFETLAVEQVGSRVLFDSDDLTILYETKIDWICRGPNIAKLPVDHKTSYRRGDTIAISNQFMGYCWMLGVHNLMVNKIGFQKTLKPSEKFTRPIMSYPSSVIDGWRRNSIWWVRRLLECEETGLWPNNFTSCDKYSGCIFRPVCESPVETRDHTAMQLFNIRDNEWDPGANL